MVDRHKFYSELFNDLLLLVVTGASVGASVFMCADYLSGSIYVQRPLWVVIAVLVIVTLCFAYWAYKLAKELKSKAKGRVVALRAIVASVALLGVVSAWYSAVRCGINTAAVYAGKKLAISDKDKTREALWQRIDQLQHMAGYYLTYVEDEVYYTTMTNTRGESLTQAPEDTAVVSVCLIDGSAVSFTSDRVVKTKNLDNLGIVKRALDFTAQKKAQLERYALEDGVEPQPGEAAYGVRIEGVSRIREFYSSFMVPSEVDEIMKGMPSNSAPTLVFGIFVSEEGTALTCSIEQYGDGALMWYVEGFSQLYDWVLSGDWYGFDFTEAERAEEYLGDTLTSLSDMLDAYGADMGVFNGIGSLEDDHDHNGDGVPDHAPEDHVDELP